MKEELPSELEFSLLNTNGLGILYCEDIYDLDLEQVKQKLQSTSNKEPWSKNKCEIIELSYKRLLILKRMFKNKVLIPNSAVVEFWKQHYMQKEKYTEDCNNVFGYYIGNFSWNKKFQYLQTQQLLQAYEETIRLYHNYFGEDYVSYSVD